MENRTIEPILRNHSLSFFSRLFLVPKKTGKMHLEFGRPTLPNGGWSICQSSGPGKRVASIYIHQRRLSTRSYVSSRVEVSLILHQQTSLPVHTSALQNRNITTWVYQASEAGSASVTSAGVHLHVYLDDWLIQADSPEMVSSHLQLAIQVLHPLRWMINFHKSELTPTLGCMFIGMHFRTWNFTMASLPKMQIKVRAIINHWRSATTVSILMVQNAGHYSEYDSVSAQRAVAFPAPSVVDSYHMGPNFRGWAQCIYVQNWVIHQLAWWVSLAVCQGLLLMGRDTDMTLYTDVSLHGWGATLGDHSISGKWSSAQEYNHVNILEVLGDSTKSFMAKCST